MAFNKDDAASSLDPGGATVTPEFDEKTGKPTNLAINNASQARELGRRLKQDDLRSRDIRRSRVMKAFNGNAPLTAQYLKDQGLDWYPNVSFNHMAGVVGRAEVPYVDFGADVRYMANFAGNLEDWQLDVLREEFVSAVKRWGGWMRQFTRLTRELNLNGWAFAAFLDEFTPWPEQYNQSRCFVPDGSPNDVNDVDVIVLERNYLIHELYSFIEDPTRAEAMGWNPENVRQCIINARPRELNRYRSWEELEKRIRDGFLYWSYVSSKVVRCFHVLVRELDGGVSHWMVEDLEGNPKKYYPEPDNSELFKSVRQWESMDDVGVYFDVEPGDGHWHGSRGVGQRAYNTHTQLDKLRNQILATAYTSGLALLEVPDEIRGEQLDLWVASPFVQVPPGVNLLSNQFPKVSQEIFEVDALLTNSSEQSLGDVVPQGRDAAGGDKTATQASIDAGRSAAVQRTALKRFVDPYSKMVYNMFCRLAKKNSQNVDAKRFQKRCMDRNVDVQALLPVVEVRGFYDIKDITGETAQATGMAFQLLRGDPAINQKNLYQRQIRSLLGPEAVLDLMPEGGDQQGDVEAERKQLNENATMMNGMDVPVTPNDKHEVEAPVAAAWLTTKMQEGAQGGDGASMDSMERVFKHLGGHLQALAQSKDKNHQMTAKVIGQQMTPVAALLQHYEQRKQAAAKMAALNASAVAARPGVAPVPALTPPPQSPAMATA